MPQYPVSGTIDTSGGLVQYSTFRYHGGGPATLEVDSYPGYSDGNWLRVGLRNPAGTQVAVIQFEDGSPLGTTMSFGSVAAGDYALNARLVIDTNVDFPGTTWSGVLGLAAKGAI